MNPEGTPEEPKDLWSRLLEGDPSLSRRRFLFLSGMSVIAVSALGPLLARHPPSPCSSWIVPRGW